MMGTGVVVDRVFVRDLVLDLEIGVFAYEKGRRQRVRFSVEAEVRRQLPANEADFYSYDLMIESIRSAETQGHVALVETHAEEVAARVLADPRLLSVIVKVEKLDIGPGAVGIEIRRSRGER